MQDFDRDGETRDLAKALDELATLEGEIVAVLITERRLTTAAPVAVMRGRLGPVEMVDSRAGPGSEVSAQVPIEGGGDTETWGPPAIYIKSADFEYAELLGQGKVAFAVGGVRITIARSVG